MFRKYLSPAAAQNIFCQLDKREAKTGIGGGESKKQPLPHLLSH
jgi:hypothetical protein